MKNLPLRILTFSTFVGGLSLFAADVWVAKPYTEWTEKEVQKIMTDSPFSRKVTVSLDLGGRGGGGGRAAAPAAGDDAGGGGGRGGGGGNDPGTDGGGGGGGGRGGRGGGGGGPQIPSVGGAPETDLIIRWQSAPTILQAWAKATFGAEAGKSDDAKKAIQPPEMYYLIWVANLPGNLRPRDNDAKKALLSVTTLTVKGKDPVAAIEVQYPPPAQGGRGVRNTADAHFVFPRTLAITPEDKEVEFATKFGKTAVKTKFNLKNMEINGKLGL